MMIKSDYQGVRVAAVIRDRLASFIRFLLHERIIPRGKGAS